MSNVVELNLLSRTVNKKDAVIFDIDGTLADITHRLHYVTGEQKNYDDFNSLCVGDIPKKDIIDLLKIFSYKYLIVIVTGREEKWRIVTKDWLDLHIGIPYVYPLRMRRTGDHRPDYIVKEEILQNLNQFYNIKFAVEDRDQVVEMWRRNGITCLQCQKGEY
jgi:phosphoglycolate phosphatase-like HAD superfamily hydrolase